MASHQQFLDAISAAPGELAPRLVYADWLEERGSPLCFEWRKPLTCIQSSDDYHGGKFPGYGFGEALGVPSGDGRSGGDSAGDGDGDGLGLFDDGDGSGDGICYGFGFSDGDGGTVS